MRLVKAESQKRSLEQYARDEFKTGGRKCWACSLPDQIRTEIEEAKRKDPSRFSNRILTGYLVEQGFSDATITKLEKHFLNHLK